MALEDRCSPQSAPSPPSLPPQKPQQSHSSHNALANASMMDMSLPQTPTQTPTVASAMLTHTAAATLYQQQQLQHLHHLQQLQQLHQQQLAAAAVAFQHPQAFQQQQQQQHRSPSAHSMSPATTPASTVTIKEEESDSIIGDASFLNEQSHNDADNEEEDDIDVDVDVDERLPPPAHQQSTAKPTLAFSISNILSDRFGGAGEGTTAAKTNEYSEQSQQLSPAHPHQHHHHAHQQQPHLSNSPAILRPFDNSRAATATPSAFTRVDLLEFSRQQQAAAAAAATAAMMIERAQFLNCFNPAAYPRIHEEIVNSRLRRNGTNGLPPSTAAAIGVAKHIIEPPPPNLTHEKSALGSLCKTVSQIGQSPCPSVVASTSAAASCLASPPPASNASTISCATTTSLSSSASSVSTGSSSSPSSRSMLPNKSSSPQPIPPPSAVSRDSGMESSDDTRSETGSTTTTEGKNEMWPAWVYCTRYSDRPSSGPRYRRPKQPKDKTTDEKRPRTAFSSEQLARLKREFSENRYLTERRRQQLSAELGLNEAQIKIWFQNKRAKIKKSSGSKNPLALQLMAQGLYNHTTVPLTKEEEELEMRMNGQIP